MWIKTISEFSKNCRFFAPASLSELENCERQLGTNLHDSLRGLLLETNGIYETESELRILFTVDEIIEQNQFFRTNPVQRDLNMPFDNLVFFADSGSGDLFAMAITGTQISRKDIFVWNHEDDSRSWVAPDLETYFNWWLSGKLTYR